MKNISKILTLVGLLLLGSFVLAQESITLVPYSNEAYGFESLIPEGWTDVGQGTFLRQSSATDPTVIVQQAATASADDVLGSLLPRMGLTEKPDSVGTFSGALEWTLYQIEVDSVNVTVDLALAEADGTAYLIILQTSPDQIDALHESVFLPLLEAFRLIDATAEPDVPYLSEEVTFENGDVTLAGTLTLPPTEGPHPVIVLVSGSGPQDRDETLGGGIAIKPFRLLADALTRAGIAVLRYDDRGVGDSTGDFSTALVSDFATDAEAAINYLLTRDEIDADQIGLLGHSEGGLVAAMLGARNDDLDFIILLAGPGVNGRDLLLLQNQRLMAAEGATQAQIDAQVAFVGALIDNLDDPAAIETLTYEYTLEQLEMLPEEQRAAVGEAETYARQTAQQAAAQYGTGWFASFIGYDPAPDWAQVTIPVLALYGTKDVQVDAEQNAPALEAALKQAGNDDFEIEVIEDANHLFQNAVTGGFSEYATLPAEFTPNLIPTILDWLAEHVEIAG